MTLSKTQKQTVQEPKKQVRCPKGTRRNRRTQVCETVPAPAPAPAPTLVPTLQPAPDSTTTQVLTTEPAPAPAPTLVPTLKSTPMPAPVPEKPVRCPKGMHRNRQTRVCEPVVAPPAPVPAPVPAPAPAPTLVPTPEPAVLVSPPPPAPTVEDQEIASAPISSSVSPDLEDTDTDTDIYSTTLRAVSEVLYPHLDDLEFGLKIAQKKEFYDTRYDGAITPIQEETEKRCRAPFELMPHQLFVKNFMSMQTPYNSLLLYHGLGTGKTLSAIGIAEEMRAYMKQVGMNKRILVLASPNVIHNFRLQLFDENRIYQENGIWHGHTSVSQNLLDEINPTLLKDVNKTQLIANVHAVIKTYYDFKGYIKFSNEVSIALKPFSVNDPRRSRKIQSMFNNHLILIDEVHNIRLTRDNQDLTTANYLMLIAKYAKNVRWVLLSATPMYNSYKEIVWLTNLMNLNDRRPEITVDQIFTKTGEFQEGGETLLRKRLTGYVSFVRGENPYTFPFRVYQSNVPTSPIHPPMYVSNLESVQERVYQWILTRMGTGDLASATAVDSASPPASPDSPFLSNEPFQQTLESLDSIGYEQLRVPVQALNIVFKDVTAANAAYMNPETLVGKQGLEQVVETTKNKQFRYVPDQAGFFQLDRIRPFSQKIATILDHIRGSTGIVMIYSEFIYGGVVPMALAMEEMGFSRVPGVRSRTQSMFATPPSKTAGQRGFQYAMITGDKDFSPDNREELARINDPQNKYGDIIKVVIISRAAAEGLDFKNIRQIHIMEPWYNMSRIEQIIGRGVRNLSHCGLPFEERNVEIYMHASRAVMQPSLPTADMHLYELSFKKAQQIGRVSKVLKSMAVDCLLNRDQFSFTMEKLAEIPANRHIKIRTSTSEGEVDFQPGDRPYTAICDYSENCEVACSSKVSESELADQQNQSTYSLNYLQANRARIVDIIRQLFRHQTYYPGDLLVEAIRTKGQPYPVEQIYYALTYLLQNRNESLVDSYGRLGRLVNRGDIYAFQPLEISDEGISVFDRTFPVEPKVSKVRLEIPTTFSAEAVEVAAAPAPEPTAAQPSVGPEMSSVSEESYTSLLNHIRQRLDEIRDATNRPLNRQSWSDSMHAWDMWSLVLKPYFGWSLDDVRRYVIHHLVDVLPLPLKLQVANHLLASKDAAAADDDLVKEIRAYMKNHVYQIQGRDYLVLANEKNTWEVFRPAPEAPPTHWEPGQYTDIQLVQRKVVEPLRASVEPREERMGSLVGFFATDTTKERWSKAPTFKVKDFTRKITSRAAKGENMLKAGKMRERALVHLALDNLNRIPVEGSQSAQKIDYNTSAYSQAALNILTEMLLRHASSEKKRLFLNTEQYAMVNVLM